MRFDPYRTTNEHFVPFSFSWPPSYLFSPALTSNPFLRPNFCQSKWCKRHQLPAVPVILLCKAHSPPSASISPSYFSPHPSIPPVIHFSFAARLRLDGSWPIRVFSLSRQNNRLPSLERRASPSSPLPVAIPFLLWDCMQPGMLQGWRAWVYPDPELSEVPSTYSLNRFLYFPLSFQP